MSFGEAKAIASTRTAVSNIKTAKTGTSSGFSSGEATARADALDPQQRLHLLEDVILSDYIWNRKDLYLYYINEMPTPQEAYRNILKPEYGFRGGSLETTDWSGFYKCTANHLLLESDSGFCITYTYSEVDATIRRLYRATKLTEK